jgi:diketogulonate reductase-like aldo/keto reductase
MRLTTASGNKIQNVIYGTGYKRWRTARLLKEALSIGYRSIDTGNWSTFTLFP